MTREMEMFRLEDRVLFEAAAAVEIVEAAEAAHDNPNANVNEGEKQAQDDRDALKNAPPENPADQAAQHDGGEAQTDPAHNADVDAQIDKIINGSLPAVDGADIDTGIGTAIDNLPQPSTDGGEQLFLNDSGETVSTGHELVVINSSVMDADAIIGELAPNQEVLRLDSGSDAMSRILDYLNASDTHYDAIHIVSHGNDGYFVLNSEVIDGNHFDAAEWAAVGEHLTEHGDIMIYGCNLAESEAGRELVGMIADASGADVAASTDATGLHGDWDLEYRHGVIETAHLTVENYGFDLNTFEVTNLNDSGTGSLRDAITQANSSPGLDDVVFRTDGTIVLGSEIAITDDVNIIGNGVEKTVISGNDANRIFTIDADTAVTLEHLTFQHGNSVSGGAINNKGTLTVIDSDFSDNNSGRFGGAIYNGNTGTLNITGSTFSGNTAAIYGGAIRNSGTVNIADSIFNGNSALLSDGGYGGAIYNGDSGMLSITDSVFSGNKVLNFGGAIENQGTLNITNSTFSGNNAGDSGGAIRNALSGTLTVANSTFSGNSAKSGGAVYTDVNDTYLLNSILVGNTASENGADVWTNGAANTHIYAYYCLIGGAYNAGSKETGLAAFTDTVGTQVDIQSADIFTGHVTDELYEIKADGTAADSGTLVGRIGGDFYYKHVDNWVKASDKGTTLSFDSANADGHYGLGADAAVYTTAQNLNPDGHPASRVQTLLAFNVGAYALYTLETPSLVVTTDRDVVDRYDGVISLREALAYAAADIGVWRLRDNDRYTITFADSLFGTVSSVTIKLDGMLGTLTLAQNTFTAANGVLAIDASAAKGAVVLDGGNSGNGATDGVQIMYINSGNDVTLSHLTFRNGYAYYYYGGAIYNDGTLTVMGSIFSDNNAADGGAIYNDGTLTVMDSTFSGNNAARGGAIYDEKTLTVMDSIFSGNNAEDRGGAIFSEGWIQSIMDSIFSGNEADRGGAIHNGGGMSVTDSSFSGNKARQGGAIHNDGTLTIADSTFSGNQAQAGGAIYNMAGDIYLLNSILVGNTATGNGVDVWTAGGDYNTHVYAYYSLIGGAYNDNDGGTPKTGLEAFDKTINTRVDIVADDIFNGQDPDGLYKIKADGAAANSGTLVGKLGNEFYFKDGNYWRKASDTNATRPFDFTSADGYYGLGDAATVYTTAQNYDAGANPVSRVQTLAAFNVGAYALNVAEVPSLVVSTDRDTLNPFDGLTSLREALAYAAADIGVWRLRDNDRYTITFADSLFGTGSVTIKLDGMLGTLTLAQNTFTAANGVLVIDASSAKGAVVIDGGYDAVSKTGGVQIMDIDSDNDVTLSHLTFQNGYAGNGGVVFNSGVLTVTNSIFRGNSASNAGGAIDNDGGILSITDSIFSDNSADSDGAIYNYGMLTVTNSTFSGNSAQNGGAISNYGMLTVTNSTFSGNSAQNGGAVYNSNDNGFGYMQIVDSTFAYNTAEQGGAIFNNNDGTVSVVDSTFSGNSADLGGAIYNFSGDAYLLNSILVGNTATDGADVWTNGNTYAYYCLIGDAYNNNGGKTGLEAFDKTINTRVDIVADDIFNGQDPDGLYKIKADGAAADSGTLTGRIGDDFYFKDGNYWRKASNTDATKPFDYTSADGYYGLGAGATVYTTAQNYDAGANPVSRVQTLLAFNVGAYALNVAEVPSLVVNTERDALNPFDGVISLREALAYAAADIGVWRLRDNDRYTITFADSLFGTGSVTIKLDGMLGALMLARNTFTAANGPLTIDASAAKGAVVLDGGYDAVNQTGGVRIMDISPGNVVTLSHLTFQNGCSTQGGAIFNGGTLSITDSIFSGNSSPPPSNPPSLCYGGAIYNRGMLSITNSAFNGNHANDNGGAIFNEHNGALGALSGTVSIMNSTFSDNSAKNGGAIFNDQRGTLSITNSTFSGNSAGSGGAIFNNNDGTLSITDSTFSGNSASENGGAVYDNGGHLQIVDSTLANNTAGNNGGAVGNRGTFILVNSTVYGNRAEGNGPDTGFGGGIYSASNGGKVIVVNSTLAGNSARQAKGGGGIYMDPGANNANLEVINSIVLGNYTGDDPTLDANKNDIAGDVTNFARSFLVYGVNTMQSNSTNGESNTASDIDKTFHAKWDNASGKWELVNRNDGSPVFRNGTVQIYADSVGATEGTLVGWRNDSGTADFNKLWEGKFYYRTSWSIDSGTWGTMDGGGNIDFITTVGTVNFGLGGNAAALLFATGQNGIARTNVSSYNAGAYTLQAHKPDTVVNTDRDSASDHGNPFDGVTTLRDAIQYAGRASWFVLDQNGRITEEYTPGNEVRFDKAFFTTEPGNKKTIVLDRKIQILREDFIRIAGVDRDGNDLIDANGESYIVIDGGGKNRIFEIGNGSRATDVAMYNLVLQNGRADAVGATRGGAVYNWGNSRLDIDRVLFRNNNAQTGGAVYNGGTLSIMNSTFSGSSASKDGGAIYNNAGTLSIVNSTLSGSSASEDGGAIYNTQGTVYLLNSILTGNTASKNGADVWTAGDAATHTYAYYCLIGNAYNNNSGNTGLDAFDKTIGTQVDIKAADILDGQGADGLYKIKADGAAAYSGTLVGKLNGDLYFKHGNDWVNASDNAVTKPFDSANADGHYGLGDAAAVYTAAQNRDAGGNPVSREQTLAAFNAGAYALNVETYGGYVTTGTDTDNPFDGVISLREAVMVYAYSGDIVTFTDSVNSVELTQGGLVVDYDLAIDSAHPVTITQSMPGNAAIFGVTAGTTLTLTGDLVLGDGKITGSGNVVMESALTGSTATVDMSGGAFTYAGSAAQTVLAGTYHDLAFRGSGARNLAGGLNITGGFNIAGTNNTAYLQVDGNAFQVALAGALSASYADLSNLNFTTMQTVQSYDAAAATNTVSGNGNTNLTIRMTPGSGSTASSLTYGQKLRETTVDLVYSLRGANTMLQFAPDSDLVLDVLRDSDGNVIARTVSGIDAVSGNYEFNNISFSLLVNPRAITVGGIGADDKTYDGGTDATLDYSNVHLNGLLTGDMLGVTASGSFADKNAGADKIVTLATLTLNGSDANNYVLAGSGQQTTATATITPKTITVSGIAADDRIYDGTTDATLDYADAVLSGKISGDILGISATGSFGDKNVGIGKVVTIGTLTLTGTDAGNYELTGSGQQTTATATIAAKTITVDGVTANDKTYDGTTNATLDGSHANLNGKVDGDSLGVTASGTFADKNAGAGKLVTIETLTLNGTDAGNYVLADSQTTATASITPRAITVDGIGAVDKTYDGTTNATLDGSHANLNGKVDGDSLGVTASGSFADKNAGVGKLVTIETLTLSGIDAGNYVLASSGQQTSTTASITPRTITVDSIGAVDKIYDGGTDATLDYSNVALNGKIAGDDLSASASGSFADKNAGADKIVTLNALTLSGADAGNYVLASSGQQTEATAAITPRAITVTADEQTKTAGDADPALTYQLTSGELADGDAFSGELTRDAGEKAGVYAIRQGTLTSGGNYSLTYVGANLTIEAKPVSDFAIYSSGLNPNFTPVLISGNVRAELKNLRASFAGNNLKLPGINSLPAALSFYNYLSDIGDGIEWNNIDFTDPARNAAIRQFPGQVTDCLGLDRKPEASPPSLIYELNQLKADAEDLPGINTSVELYENGNIFYGPDNPVVSVRSAGNADFRYPAPELPRIQLARYAEFADAELQKLLRDFDPIPDYAPLEKSRVFKSEIELLLDNPVTA